MKKIIFLFFIFNFTFSQNIITDRPDKTESPITLKKNYFQIENGILINSNNENEIDFFPSSNLFRFGLTDDFELRFASEVSKPFANIPVEIGVKYQFVKSDFNLALISHLIIETSETDENKREIASSNLLTLSHQLNENVQLGYNLGFELSKKKNVFYSATSGFSLSDDFTFGTEIFGELENLENHKIYFDAIIAYLVDQNFQLDFAIGKSLNDNFKFTTIGVSYRLPN